MTTRTSRAAAAGLAALTMAVSAGAAELLCFDWNAVVTKSHHGFPKEMPPRDGTGGDWTDPVNYAQGKFYYRVELRSMPVAKTMKLQLCFYQDGTAREECGPMKQFTGTTGGDPVVVTWSADVDSMWCKAEQIDWTRARSRVQVAIKNSSGRPVSDYCGWDWNGENPDEWYPMDLRFTSVVVSPGATFSGWENYVGGGGGENSPPTVRITKPSPGDRFVAGKDIAFSCDASDTNGDTLTYTWKSDLDGKFGESKSVTTSNLRIGDHRITVTVSDGTDNASAHISITVWSGNHPPSVTIVSPSEGSVFAAGDPISFSSSAKDPEGASLSYSWKSSRDGEIGSSAGFTKSDLSVGSHTVTVTVTDEEGESGSARVNITIIRDSDRDGLPDGWEEKYGLDPDDSDTDDNGVPDPSEDPDEDGFDNLDEYLAGTDPTDPGSVPYRFGGGGGGISCTPGAGGAARAVCLAVLAAGALLVLRARRRRA